MQKFSLKERLRYRFDNTLSKGPIALIGWLFVVSLIMILVISLIVQIAGIGPTLEDGSQQSFFETLWGSLMHSIDAGTVAGDTDRGGFLLAMFIMTLGGIFIVSILIGVLTSGIESKLDELRKGRSVVIERDHTVILGWSPQIFSIIGELIAANTNKPRSCIAILADHDKVEMEDQIRTRIGKPAKTRIICRSGNPVDLADLEVINPHASRSIIILAPEEGNPDSVVIKTLLALTNNPKRRKEPYHIVAELHDPKNIEIARMVGGKEAQLVVVGDLIGRITVQTCLQSGLSLIYTDLLDFGGDEIYFTHEPALTGKTFGEALLAFEDSALIGLRFGDGRVQLNPPMETSIGPEDRVIAISRDDDTIRLSRLSDYGIDEKAINLQPPPPAQKERTLVLGWNERACIIIKELDNYVAPGSEVLVVAEEVGEQDRVDSTEGLANLRVRFQDGDITDRDLLNELEIWNYPHVIVLSYSDRLDPQEADAQTLITLLHLRNIEEHATKAFSIVSEMLDVRNRQLAEVTKADDFIVSDKLVGLMLSQISENSELADVFADLFDADGAEIYLKPASEYVALGQPLNFYTVVEAARRRGEVAIGYRLQSEASDPARTYGVHLNPPKSQKSSFASADRVIVLAN